MHELRLTKTKTSCHAQVCMLQLYDVTRIDRKMTQAARYMYTYTLTFISIPHDDQSSDIQTSSFFLYLFLSSFVITNDLSMIVTYCCFVFFLQVYTIADLRYVNESDLLSLGMSKPQYRKIKRHLPSSSNTALSNNPMLTSTWGKLLVRVSRACG